MYCSHLSCASMLVSKELCFHHYYYRYRIQSMRTIADYIYRNVAVVETLVYLIIAIVCRRTIVVVVVAVAIAIALSSQTALSLKVSQLNMESSFSLCCCIPLAT
jgi:hypothetical protein